MDQAPGLQHISRKKGPSAGEMLPLGLSLWEHGEDPSLLSSPAVSRVPWGGYGVNETPAGPCVLDVACCVWVVSCTWAKRQRKSRCGVMGFAERAPRGEAV